MDSQDFRFYASIYVQRLRYLVIPIVMMTVVGFAVALLLPPVFRVCRQDSGRVAPCINRTGPSVGRS